MVFAGVDYSAILARAQAEADVIVWDGGNNDLPFFAPTLHLCLVDPHRCGHESRYHPGEANLRMADVAVIVKEDSASPSQVETVSGAVAALNPRASCTPGFRSRSSGPRWFEARAFSPSTTVRP